MAKETTTRLIDDLDGGVAERTVAFTWDGRSFEIDLSKKNLAALDKALKPYVAAARRLPRVGAVRPRRAGRAGGAGDRGEQHDIREWARSNGYQVSDRGRIASAVVEAYKASR